jgi:hypothetical protein
MTEEQLEKYLATNEANVELYIARLIQSEWRTIYFYQVAAHCLHKRLERHVLQQRLHANDVKKANDEPTMSKWMSTSDAALIQTQVDELVETYIQIRHSRFQDS